MCASAPTCTCAGGKVQHEVVSGLLTGAGVRRLGGHSQSAQTRSWAFLHVCFMGGDDRKLRNQRGLAERVLSRD